MSIPNDKSTAADAALRALLAVAHAMTTEPPLHAQQRMLDHARAIEDQVLVLRQVCVACGQPKADHAYVGTTGLSKGDPCQTQVAASGETPCSECLSWRMEGIRCADCKPRRPPRKGQTMTPLDQLLATWRERARSQAKRGVKEALGHPKGFVAKVSDAFTLDECADELAAALADCDCSMFRIPRPSTPPATTDELPWVSGSNSVGDGPVQIPTFHVPPATTALREADVLKELLTDFVLRERALRDAQGRGGQHTGHSPSISPSVLKQLEAMFRDAALRTQEVR